MLRKIVFAVTGALLLTCVLGFLAAGPLLRYQHDQIAKNASEHPVSPHDMATCRGPLNVGYRTETLPGGVLTAIWYPTLQAETTFQYPNGFASPMAPNAAVADCGRYPLVVFSHGFGGCGTQSTFFTEALARAGYIVAAPDHKDSQCKIDRPGHMSLIGLLRNSEEPFLRPKKWTDDTYRDRYHDMETVIDSMLKDPQFARSIDSSRIGAAGHSLGGYTVMGLAGARSSWKDDRVKALLLFSPYVDPYLVEHSLSAIHVPVMYQGGTSDRAGTTKVKKPDGAYAATNSPKYFVEFPSVSHLGWSNAACKSYGSNQACLMDSASVKSITEYGIAFLDRYLKNEPEPLLNNGNHQQLADFRHEN